MIFQCLQASIGRVTLKYVLSDYSLLLTGLTVKNHDFFDSKLLLHLLQCLSVIDEESKKL
jgi:hypothetical protein